jgi:hypothetical protein
VAYKRKTPIWQFSRRAAVAVLPRHARRFLALLEKARLIDYQDACFIPQVLRHIGAQFIAHPLPIW